MTAALEDLDYEYASATARRAVLQMAERGVLPTPNNFSVWFNYGLGTSPDLKRAMDILAGNKKKFDVKTMRDLFSAYVDTATVGNELSNSISQQLTSIMNDAKYLLNVAISDNHTQLQAMGRVADQAGAGADPQFLIERLVNELSNAATRAKKLESQFVQTSGELDKIRASLNTAEERAKTDILTGLPNRRALEEFFRTAQIAAMEDGRPMSVMLIDIDHFKKFNDTFGHGVGDQVLRLVANVLRERVREYDLPARYGGEEFIAVLPGADLTTGEAIAERIRLAICECHIKRRSTGDLLPGITVSIGVGEFRPGESMADLIERCDRALYRAKGSGRNQVLTEIEVLTELVADSVDDPRVISPPFVNI
jgi:diguanylate cyclase